jgi:hypothetical protein
LSSRVAALSNLLLAGVCKRWRSLRTLLFSSIFFCLIIIGQCYASSVLLYSGVAFQPAHSILSLKNLAVASMLSSAVREVFEINNSNSVLIYLRANLTVKKPITKLARVKNKQTQKI